MSQITKTEQNFQPDTASTEISYSCSFLLFKLLSNKTTVFVTSVLSHTFTPHQQMADTFSLLLPDPIHTIMQRTVIEITVV